MKSTHQLGQFGRTLRLPAGGGEFAWPEGLLVYMLTFEGLDDFEAVLEFYNGGTGDLGSSGPNYGVSFTEAMLGVIDQDDGGNGNFANEPSPITSAYYYSSPAVMSSSVGLVYGMVIPFSTAVPPLDWSGPPYPAIANARFYRGVGGTGDLVSITYQIVSLYLGAAGTRPLGPGTEVEFPILGFDAESGDPTGAFQRWCAAHVYWTGEVKSVVFTDNSTTPTLIGFDDITFARNP